MADPGTQMVVKVAAMAASAALNMSQKFEGPRLDTLDVTTAEPGTPIPDIYGYARNDGCSIVHAEKLRERKVESKTKGGKFSNYKYYGTWKNILAGHEIDAVAKLRWDRKLVYDATKKGPISVLLGLFEGFAAGSPVKLSQGRNFRIDLGTSTQLPDPRYVAWCEDRYGPDSAPAYRDTAIVTFIDVPLEKVGNRIPTVSADVVRVKTTAFLSDTIDGAGGASYSPDFLRFTMDGAFYDTATHQKVIDITHGLFAWSSNGSYWHLTGNFPVGPTLVNYSHDGQNGVEIATSPIGADAVFVIPQINAGVHSDEIILRPFGAVLDRLILLEAGLLNDYTIDFAPTKGITDADGTAYLIGRQNGGSDGIYVGTLQALRAGGSADVITTSSTAVVTGWLNAEGNWVLLQGDTAYLVDPSTLTVFDSVTGPFDVTDMSSGGGTSFWSVSGSTAIEYSMLDLSTTRSIDLTAWGGSGTGGVYDPINHAINQTRSAADNRLLYLDRIDDDSVINLSDILDIECGLVNVTDQSYSGTDPEIQGWLVTQGSVADRVGPLLEMHDIDARPHDFGIQWLVRGTAAALAIESDEFVKEGDVRWQAPITQDVSLPRQVNFSYADATRDDQKNTAVAQRSGAIVDSNRVKSIDMSTFRSDPEEAQPLAERKFRREWFERESQEFSLQMRHASLEPGDIRQISLDDNPRVCRLVELTKSQGLLQTKWVRDDPRVHDENLSAGPTLDGRDEEELYISGPTKAFVLDTTYIEDAENTANILLHMGAGAYSTTTSWPGASIYQLDPVENEYDSIESVESSNRAAWGYATDALAGVSPAVWDDSSSVTINLKGTLVSRTQDDIYADPTINLAYLGDEAGQGEWLNFAEAELNGDGTWTISSLWRGRRGTEWAIGEHIAGDLFVLASNLQLDTLGIDELGNTLIYKGQSEGRTLDGAPEIPVPIVARSLKPYSPTALTALRDTVSDDWELAWTRRTRVGGNWSSETSIPLSETTEAYRVRFFDEAGVEVASYDTTDPDFTYEAADQVTDFGVEQTQLHWSVCQLGDVVEGFQEDMRVGFPANVLGVGTFDGTNTLGSGITPGLPTGLEAGDLMILACETNSGDTIAAPAGWEDDITPQAGTDSKLHLFWKRAGHSETAPTVVRTGDHLMGQIVAVRDLIRVGYPFDNVAGGTATTSTMSIPGFTTDTNNCLILDFGSCGSDTNAVRFSSWTNADLTDLDEVFDSMSDAGGGGGVGCNSGMKATAGAVGATTVTIGGTVFGNGCIKVAIKPA